MLTAVNSLFIASIVGLAVSAHIVIKRLKTEHHDLYDSWGKPEFGLLPFDSGWGFISAFGGILGYRSAKLDQTTLRWCHVLFVCFWLFWGGCIAFLWQIIG